MTVKETEIKENTITLDTPIEKLELYKRGYNFLKRHSIHTVNQLVSRKKDYLESIGAEWMIIKNIEDRLKEYGLFLGMEYEDRKKYENNELEVLDDLEEVQQINNSLKSEKEEKLKRLKTLNTLLREKIRLEAENNILEEQIKDAEDELGIRKKVENNKMNAKI